MKVKETNYNSDKTILKYPNHHVGVALNISDEGIEPNLNGLKIIPAGTLVGNSVNGVITVVNGEKTEGVLLHDVDVTYGNRPATMIIHGFIDLTKIPSKPSEEAIKALPMVKFI